MSAAELKLEIINKVSSITDDLVLEEIYKLVNLESKIDTIYCVTDQEREAVEVGLIDVKEGRVYSSESAESLINTWLKK